MFRIKRLYIYVLQTFVPVFFMTFAICLFIILMQFVWKYVEDLVGKGLEPTVIAELFTYAALTLVPMALPLAILLASLMAFGNLGERYELLAIKAAGISLLKTMRPLIVLVGFISLGAFFFQDDVIPKVQVKFRALMISIRQKSPELDIPENTFYSGIDDYNLFVKTKDKETGMLYNVMIYDVSKGFDNMAVIVCDSGKLKMSSNKDYLLLNLYNGQQFSNFQQSGMVGRQATRNNQFVPYMRENFKERELVMPFDANFSRVDESSMEGTQIAKNISELRLTIDSLTTVIHAMDTTDRKVILKTTYLSYRSREEKKDSNDVAIAKVLPEAYNFDSVMSTLSQQDKVSVYSEAMMRAENNKNDLMFRSLAKVDTRRKLRQHDVELQGKFSLSFACLVFFFIGAPLGAIIRKGGLGMPVVISVAMFIFYYIINNIGYKMARDGVWEVWQGVWLSSFVLFPLGVFITYKAVNDSALFNPEAYGRYFRKLFFIRKPRKMTESDQEAVFNKIPELSDISLEPSILKGLEVMDSDNLREIVENNKGYSYDRDTRLGALSILKSRGADINSIVDQQNSEYSKANMGFFNSSVILSVIAYLALALVYLLKLGTFIEIFGIIYLVLYLRSVVYYFNFYGKVNKKTRIINVIIAILLLLAFPVTYLFLRKRMINYIKKAQIIF